MSFPPVTRIVGPFPLPVQIVPDEPYTTVVRRKNGATLVKQDTLVSEACLIDIIAGYNSEPTTTTLSFVQLHDAAGAIINGAVPTVIIPVYGGKTSWSFGVEVEFANGLVIALSSTELTYTALASPYLNYNAVFRI